MYNDIERVLLSQEVIEKRIEEIAAELDKEYDGKMPLVICILKGSYMFFAKLSQCMKTKHNVDFMTISSYGSGTESSGKVKMMKDAEKNIEGRDVIIVEDIIDSGNTMSFLKNLFMERNPKSVKLVTLLDKPSRREVEITPDYCGFEVPDYFVVGYGLDYNEVYRNMPDIGILKEEIYR
ncbi:MAG: hypoxanthine phosphoribosyltransferase [Bacillota bacterium]